MAKRLLHKRSLEYALGYDEKQIGPILARLWDRHSEWIQLRDLSRETGLVPWLGRAVADALWRRDEREAADLLRGWVDDPALDSRYRWRAANLLYELSERGGGGKPLPPIGGGPQRGQ